MAAPKIPVDLILNKLAEDAQRVSERTRNASDVLLEPMEAKLAQTPYDVVYEQDRVKLKHYVPETPELPI